MRAITSEIVREFDMSAPVEAIRPPRLNFARICLWCDERDCRSSECIEWYERSSWMVCPDCGGIGWSEALEPCGCMFGVVEAWPAPVDGDRRGAV
jgi:hypothetical protein